MAKRKTGCDIHGILLLDKRLGVSSNRALQEVRRLLDAKKAGHTGSLDPLASGLLPLCFGEATKVSALMLDDNKRYRVIVQLGVMTDTGDSEGVVVANKPVPDLTLADVEACLQSFIGEIDQVPPMYSALKHNGKKLYELAREGKNVERKARRIEIFELKLLAFCGDRLTLEVFCSKGTYIRSLAEDIGQALNSYGTVTELRRLEAGCFSIENAWTFDQLAAMDRQTLLGCLIEVDRPLSHLPAVQLSDKQAVSIRYGQSLELSVSNSFSFEPESKKTMWEQRPAPVRMYCRGLFLGLGEMRLDDKLAPKKLFNLDNSPA